MSFFPTSDNTNTGVFGGEVLGRPLPSAFEEAAGLRIATLNAAGVSAAEFISGFLASQTEVDRTTAGISWGVNSDTLARAAGIQSMHTEDVEVQRDDDMRVKSLDEVVTGPEGVEGDPMETPTSNLTDARLKLAGIYAARERQLMDQAGIEQV